MMPETLQFTRVDFKRFKAFSSFTLHLRRFNILVGPNNAGKSTILAAFRILAAGIRRAKSRNPQSLIGPDNRRVQGHLIDLAALSVGEENIFFDYDDSEPASVTFTLSNKCKLILYFPEIGSCFLIPDHPNRRIASPSAFKTAFNCPIGFVPVLGPVDHDERLYEREAARQALFNYRAARNFRNIWHHYPDNFETFRETLRNTWPGMDILPPEVNMVDGKSFLHMFCPEERIPREIFWAGFGFQVWCQMLTHLIQSADSAIFLIDEPDIYLHSDLQRHLLSLLQNLGPDILIATHSTEIISEAEPNDIVLIDKRRQRAQRIKDPTQLTEVFTNLGSNLNPTLTQLAKTRCAIFVEGKDFQVFARYARKLKLDDLANRATFAEIPIGGFNPDRIPDLKEGMELTLGGDIRSAVILDRDFRSNEECDAIKARCEEFCELAIIHDFKEVENYLLVPNVIDRAARKRVEERARRTGHELEYQDEASGLLEAFSDDHKHYVMSQYISLRVHFVRRLKPHEDESTISQMALDEFEIEWSKGLTRRLQLVPAKDAISHINRELDERYGVSVTTAGIIDATLPSEIPIALRDLLERISKFVNRHQ